MRLRLFRAVTIICALTVVFLKIGFARPYERMENNYLASRSLFTPSPCNVVDRRAGKREIRKLLQSDDPNMVDTYKGRGLEWDDKCTDRGKINFAWKDANRHQHVITLSSGKKIKGPVKVRLTWDNELGYYVFTTKREVAGKIVIATSRFKRDGRGGWTIKSFNRNRFRVVEILKSPDPNKIEAYKDRGLVWNDKCGDYGEVYFAWRDTGGKMHKAALLSGRHAPGEVEIRLTWDSELGYYVFNTKRVVNGKIVTATSRFKRDGRGGWTIRSFNRNRFRIVEMLKSPDPNKIDVYRERGLAWDDKCTDAGRVLFSWPIKDGRRHHVQLSTGKEIQGPVKVSLNWDNELGYYVFTTERVVDGKMIVSYARFEKNKKGRWVIRRIKMHQMCRDRNSVEQEFKRRRQKGIGCDEWALLYGKYPDRYLYDAARRVVAKLDELTILDRDYNSESRIVSIRRAGQDRFTVRTREEVKTMLEVLIDGKETELKDRSRDINPEIVRGQIGILKGILDRLASSGGLSSAVKELLGLNVPLNIEPEDIDSKGMEFLNKRVAEDPYQNAMVNLCVNPKARVVLIQGGPGSGKSTALAETICQMVRQGKKVLLTAHDNSALDNILEKLDSMEIPILRATNARNITELDKHVRNNRISPFIKDYCIRDEKDGYQPQFSREGRKEFSKRRRRFSGVVLGVTVDSSVINSAVLKFRPEVVTLDEAGLCNAVDTITTGVMASEKIILVGDHKQLPHYYREEEYRTPVYKREYKDLLRESYLAKSWDRGHNRVFLARNYRSHPLITNLVARLFYERLMVPKPRVFRESDTVKIVDVKMEGGKPNEQTVILESGQEFQNKIDLQNPKEARQCIIEFENAIMSGYPISEITVMTGYTGQVELIKSLLREYLKDKPKLLKGYGTIEQYLERHVLTINQSRGRENGVVILSFVRSNSWPYKVGFMGNLLRLNVALSRAKDRLILIGDMETLRNASETDDDRIFAGKFKEIGEILKEFDLFRERQKEQGLFTIHEAIQEESGIIDLRETKNNCKLKLDGAVLGKMRAVLTGMVHIQYSDTYPVLEALHETAILAADRGEAAVCGVKEDEYAGFMRKLTGISDAYSDIIKVDKDQRAVLLWLKDSKGEPVTVDVVKEVGITYKAEIEQKTVPPAEGSNLADVDLPDNARYLMNAV